MNDPNPTVDASRPEEAPPLLADAPPQPERIGRYRVERVLGQGGFGLVYLAHDDELQRLVAIKVPHRRLVPRKEQADAYLTEARTVARLDHPNIVPVFDVGSTADCPFFVVSKFIDGSTLASRVKDHRPDVAEAAELVATVAEALHYAHKHGIVHRDIKPGNILLDKSGKPHVADFGLALREQDVGRGTRYAGTPAYMSPEQARGEGHRVDGRSDLFSLGVVLYELLTGRRPFQAASREELLEQITGLEVRPPRQWDDTIPRELERICLKALAKRASERYSTARDMADDLRHFLAGASAEDKSAARGPGPNEAAVTTPTLSDGQPVKIVPKGLRSFDAHDADFFLELLPGPRDREGLPDSIRFWKTRIEEEDPEQTFSAGVIYGPSGCGKSSLVKAGLLPRLSDLVLAVYVEATAEETETRLLNGLRKRCPGLPGDLGLKETLAALRRGDGIPAGKKVLIVLDQFEQWLHAKRGQQGTELMQALRQCDGGRVQGVVMVRDDFWLAVSRFVRELEVNLVPGRNIALVDLFDLDHAREVLAAFGRAFGKLPEKPHETGTGQRDFLNRAASGLSQDHKVICVRLALFAEMMKGRLWTSAALKEVGGTEGVGVTFLEDTFSSPAANPRHRLHQKAARAVLKALLPDSGTDIKGTMRSYAQLLAASGYAGRPGDFDDLLRILDGETRLLTPTDPEGEEGEESSGQVQAGAKFYQLTHDYLVHSLRDWLTRKQKETRRGRAELRLAERAALWQARPESRHLPAWWEWLNIRLLTRKKDWTPPQRKMMRKAARFHAVRGLALVVLLTAVTLVGLAIRGQVIEQQNAEHASGLVRRLLDADTARVPAVIAEMEGYRGWVDPKLREENEKAAADSRQKLHTSLALLPVDEGQVEYLYQRLLNAGPTELPVIREALAGRRDALVGRLWGVLENTQADRQQRFRAACALAAYDVTGDDANRKRWESVSPFVAGRLLTAVQQNPSHYGPLVQTLRPVRDRLVGPLSEVFRNRERPDGDRSWAASILSEYAADRPDVLADLLLDADDKQFTVIYAKLKEQGERGLPVVTGEVDKKLPADATEDARERLAKRQANAAVALLRLGQPDRVWPLLKHSPDPRERSYLVHRFGPLGADAGVLVKRLEEEPDVTIRRALVLSLGPEEFGEEAWTPEGKGVLVRRLQATYRTATDPGLHAAAEWLLRQWHEEVWLAQTDETWAKDGEQREKRLEGIRQELMQEQEKAKWYVNGQGQTMVVIPGPVEFVMGSPPTEAGRNGDERQHRRRIGRTFAIAAKPVTVKQYRELSKGYEVAKGYAPTEDCPVHGTDWYMAAAYCNWLSKQEKIPEDQWCYETNWLGRVTRLKENYLSRTGYRLPTEAEWEYACRAGAVTSRHYGESEELLKKYAWFWENAKNRSWPVGGKKPNDLGLFDMHGSVWTWCQDRYKDYPEAKGSEAAEDKEDIADIEDKGGRALRGGSFGSLAAVVRSALRNGGVASHRLPMTGFRVARTIR